MNVSVSYSIIESCIDHQKLLQGRYEAERLPNDFTPERIVPDFAFNILNTCGLLYRPVVDEDYLTKGGSKPVWPGGKPFAVCLTHDVDWVTLYSYRQALRVATQSIRREINWKEAIKAILSFGRECCIISLKKCEVDSMHCYERWLKVEGDLDAHSTFFFWPGWGNIGKHHLYDCTYELTDQIVFDLQKCTVGEMIQEIDRRGWEIGLHSSWYSFDNSDEMKRQKEALENILRHDVVSVRQHLLHYDIRITPRVQAEAGLRYDSTLGFNDNIGFRFGTSYPWKLYNLKTDETLPITEIPLIIQDGAMLNSHKGMRLNEDMAFKYVLQLIETVEHVGGVLTLLWHPNYIIDPHWFNLYMRTLEELKKKNPWFASIKEIGEWWEDKYAE